jgi:signal peptidase I
MNLAEMDTLSPQSEPAQNRAFAAPTKAAKDPQAYLRQSMQLAIASVLAFLVYLFITHFILESVQVVGPSMMPTLHNADHYFLKRWIYYVRAPRRGDVIVLKDPTDGEFAVKRIIGVAGDSVCLRDGYVYVNGRKLDEYYLPRGTATATCTAQNISFIGCGKDRFFVMGDNRDNSFDSRYYGPIPRGNIMGVITP